MDPPLPGLLLERWGILDLCIFAYLAVGALGGLATGFARLAARLAGIAAGWLIAARLARPVAGWLLSTWPALADADRLLAERLAQLPPVPGAPFAGGPLAAAPAGEPGPFTLALGLLLVLFAVQAVVTPVLGFVLGLLTLGAGSPVDRLLGAALGLLQAAAWTAALLALATVLAAWPPLAAIQAWIEDSQVARWLLGLVLRVAGWRA